MNSRHPPSDNHASWQDSTKDPRPGRRFTAPEPGQQSGQNAKHSDQIHRAPFGSNDPAPGQHFSPDTDSKPLVTDTTDQSRHAERRLADSLAPPRKRRWGLLGLLTGGITLGVIELGRSLPASLAAGDWLNAGWQMLGLTAVGLGTAALARELFRLRRLRRHDKLREALNALPQASHQHALATAQLLRQGLRLDEDHPHWQAFIAASQPHHDGQDIYVLLDHHLLAPRDREASRLISRMSSETAVLVAVSPLTLVDMALVAWRHFAMIDRLSRLYGLELNYASRLRLLRHVLRDMAFAGVSEMASDASMQLVSMNLAGKLSSRAAQGLGVGLLGARLGLRAQRLVRPLNFAEDERPRLSDLRSEMWQRLRRLESRAVEPD
ncbi:TIGR01620 family protein [Halomonas halocynthiae]|uniref:TIGR01620 family protein n=1 Tax=Halomonas halocynthiae TaxID=176290 RepID=UPI000420C04E|nr:TIGR01620 family protein [Halomonas halocynthiae]